MKFLIDAHLPYQLAVQLNEAGHDALHTKDLPLQNRTPDESINQLSLDEQRIVVTKDSDFVYSHLVQAKPYKLLVVSTGNIKNSKLLQLSALGFVQIIAAFEAYSYVELGYDYLTIHH